MPDSISTPARHVLSRRQIIAATAAGAAAATGAGSLSAQPATPSSSIDMDAFRALCVTLTGIESLPDDVLEQLLGLLLADEDSAAGLPILLDASGDDLISFGLPREAIRARFNILNFLFLGEFDGNPVPNRPELVGSLASYQALPYSTVPAVCKRFGFWAEPVELPDRS